MVTHINFKLRTGRDHDLITWVNSLPERERSFWIRRALRKALSLEKGGEAYKPNYKVCD